MRVHRPRPLVTRPTVSVVIPCYKYGHFLPDAVASALDQDGVDVQVIVVDDCSPDGSADVARGLAERDPRVEVLVHETNKGHIATYNDGLALARGDYVVLVSADDLLVTDALTRAVALMEHHPEIGMVYGAVRPFAGAAPVLPVQVPSRWAVWSGEEWGHRVFATGTNVAYSPEVVLRSSVQREIGGYDPEHPHAGDFLMWLRAGSVAGVGVLGDSVQALYRQHGDNMHSSVFAVDEAAGMVTDLLARRKVIEAAAPSYARSADLEATGRLALAVEAVDLASRAYVWGLTEQWPVDDLLAFAVETSGDVRGTSAWRALVRRQRAGTRLSRRNPAFVPRERLLSRIDGRHRARRLEGMVP